MAPRGASTATSRSLRRVATPPGGPACLETPVSALAAAITPTRRFFVRSHFPVPRIPLARWRLRISGAVAHPRTLAWSDIRSIALTTSDVLLECAGNSRSSLVPATAGVRWGPGAVGTARWTGIRLRDVLESVGPRPGVREVVLHGADFGREPGAARPLAYAMSLPLTKALAPETLLAVRMNGRPLTPAHGAPLRAVVPGWYGMASVKWLTRIELREQPFTGFFRARGYAYIRPGDPPALVYPPADEVRVKSQIVWPTANAVVRPGPLLVRGRAWSGAGAIERVTVTAAVEADGGPRPAWSAAAVTPGPRFAWSSWTCRIDLLGPGFYLIRSCATDRAGNQQPATADWNVRGLGANAIAAVPVEVRGAPRPRR